jgi:hypothetical protein
MTRRYVLRFADGKRAVAIDTTLEAPEVLIPRLVAMFADGYVVEVIQ